MYWLIYCMDGDDECFRIPENLDVFIPGNREMKKSGNPGLPFPGSRDSRTFSFLYSRKLLNLLTYLLTYLLVYDWRTGRRYRRVVRVARLWTTTSRAPSNMSARTRSTAACHPRPSADSRSVPTTLPSSNALSHLIYI